MTNSALAVRNETGDQLKNGGRPTHVHQCTGEDDGKSAHTWLCDSPYCEVMADNCTVHGGVPPVRIGREPWRGR